jgi:branched-chain amino acid aminotransferase
MRKELLPKPGPDHQYVFGGISTDHMLHCDYDIDNGGWQKPVIKPVEPLELDPSNATLHYSIECFEGCKAYLHQKDPKKVILYRVNKNFERMNNSHR